MKHFVFMSLVLALSHVHVHGAPVDQPQMEPGSCKDPVVLGAAEQAMTKINSNLVEGYILKLLRVSNVHTTKHGEGGVVFYLNLDVVESTCHVVSKKDWKTCETRSFAQTAVYGQCNAVIFINKVKRMVQLYKYDCSIRPVSAKKLWAVCPDCPSFLDKQSPEIQKTIDLSLKKFNTENNYTNYFTLHHISRALAQFGIAEIYIAEYIIQETTCKKSAENLTAENCPPMDCEFAHKGFCKGSHYHPQFLVGPVGIHDNDTVNVECEIYESEAAEHEKKMHNLGGQTDHPHNDTKAHDPNNNHDHMHDHTKSHEHHDSVHKHSNTSDHHHTHDHSTGSAFRHAHDHSHDHGHNHDHVHAHHAQAEDHSGDSPNHHHNYHHDASVPTHDHDHEIALDHDHKHAHLHDHEHHHHHHTHPHETTHHDHPEGNVTVLPALDVDVPMVIPSFPDQPAADPDAAVADAPAPDAAVADAPAPDEPTTMSIIQDPHSSGKAESTILPFPTSTAAGCPAVKLGGSMLEDVMAEDPMFKQPA
ncbi:fetuin-B-like [Thalassophryne amazonica]|uniref:fetuin-B-like n=1 Tax=Thalassophryne amazonica TaxID=390379 RepID=UPI0014717848|nr:fetuin-B-like [Thalassophryne amazonica]